MGFLRVNGSYGMLCCPTVRNDGFLLQHNSVLTMLLPCVVQMLQSDLAECNRAGDEAAVQPQVDALASEGKAPESTAAEHISPSASDGADDHHAEAASQQQQQQQQQEAGLSQKPDADSPNQEADSMLDAPAVLEAGAPQQENDTAIKTASVPAEVADLEEAEVPGTEEAAADVPTDVPAIKDGTPITKQSFRKPGRQRKSQKPTAGASGEALQLNEGKPAGRAVTRGQLAKTGKILQPGMQDSAVLASVQSKPSKADSASDSQQPQLLRSRKSGKQLETEEAGALAESQPHCHLSSRNTAEPTAAAANTTTHHAKKLGCSKCRYVKTGCTACRQRLSGFKEALGRGGRKKAPSASAAPRKASEVQHSSCQVADTCKQLSGQKAPARGPEPNSRAARASNRALKRPISRRGSDEESAAEQLAIKPMPASLQHRKLQSSSQHEAHAHKQPKVKATPCEAVTVDLPADRPSSSPVAQTATLSSGASPQPTGSSLVAVEAPFNLRRSARHQQSAQPAVSGITPRAAARAATNAAATAVAAPTAAATPAAAEQVAPETVRRSGRARKPVLLQYDLLTKAQGGRSPPDDAKAQPPQSKAGRTESAASKGVKRSAGEHAVISDSEDDTPAASTASADAPAGKSTARRKKVCRQQAGLCVLSPIQEADEERDQQPGPHPASEFVNHMVHTSSDIAQHLAGLSPAEKRKRRRKAPASIRDGSPAKSRLAVSAAQSQQQTEPSNPMNVLLAAAEYSEAHAQQDSELKSARVKVSQPPISHHSASSSKSLIVVNGCASACTLSCRAENGVTLMRWMLGHVSTLV